ncbi:MAG: hypothetical protein K6T75_08885 [Acetobacteraceae bacterium]|nr:hypothetical protein [Acetobacteraceae bacterium]
MKRLRGVTIVAVASCSFLLLGASALFAAAIPADKVVFCRYGSKTGMTTTFQLWSPLRSGGTELFPAVTSKWNQPRAVSESEGESNPHLGCDLDVSGQVVYPLFEGWVDLAENGEIVVYLDLDGDGVRDDGAWAHYKHMSQIWVNRYDAVEADTHWAYPWRVRLRITSTSAC